MYLAQALSTKGKDYFVINVEPETKTYTWLGLLKLDKVGKAGMLENEFLVYVNGLGRKVLLCHGVAGKTKSAVVELLTKFTGYNCSNLVPHMAGKSKKNSTMHCKPDIAGVPPFSDGEKPLKWFTWWFIIFIMELKCRLEKNFDFNTIHEEIINTVYLIFSKQIHCHLVIAPAFHQYHLYLTVLSRYGVIYTDWFDICKKPGVFLQVLVGLFFCA